VDYAGLAHLYDEWIDYPGYALDRDWPEEEYRLRLARARAEMARAELDALVITSSSVGQWFTSLAEPHEWHDRCQARSAWFIVTHGGDYLYMSPTSAGEHFNTTRRSTWVNEIRAIVERSRTPRHEIWDVEQMPGVFAELGLDRGRLGFELGDCMTLGISVNDFLRLRELVPRAQLVDGAPVVRRLMSIHTLEEIRRTREACRAGVWIHNHVPSILRPGLSERELISQLTQAFDTRFADGYEYRGNGAWDVRNPAAGDSNFFHSVITDRRFREGDLVCRGTSGASYRGYPGDVDRVWYVGTPPDVVRRWYSATWECNQAMAEVIAPGARCSDMYAAYVRAERRSGVPERRVGRVGHGLRNTGGLSVHPDNHTVLEPGMIISVEAMFGHEYGFYDVEDQYLVTESGCEILHERCPGEIPVISA
jgi:Xaa-Pro aminopeptidase